MAKVNSAKEEAKSLSEITWGLGLEGWIGGTALLLAEYGQTNAEGVVYVLGALETNVVAGGMWLLWFKEVLEPAELLKTVGVVLKAGYSVIV